MTKLSPQLSILLMLCKTMLGIGTKHAGCFRSLMCYLLFVCVEVLRPSQPIGSCRARSVYLATRLLGRLSPLKRLTSIVHILSPETDNCPS